MTHTKHSRTVRAAEAVNRRTTPTVRGAAIIAALAIVAVLALLLVAGQASAYPPLKPGIVKVDTGNLQEDEQPAWTAKLARAKWDYNPGCDLQGARFDWFAPGQPCNQRGVRFPSGVRA